MPHLYIGNVSKQVYMFVYRSLERQGTVTHQVPIGGQVRVSPSGNPELSAPEIDNIVNQHRIYDLIDVDNTDEFKGDKFPGLLYSIGKPISVEKLRRGMQKYEDSLNAQGKQLRQEAALAVNKQIEEQTGRPLRNLEMSFQEEEPRGGYADDFDHVAEGVRVTRLADAPRGRRA